MALRSFAAARWRARRFRTRSDIERYQAQRLAQLQLHLSANVPFYQGGRVYPFTDLPVIEKADLLENFAEMNIAGITLGQVRSAIAEGEERIGGHIVGQSTGTSGNRGYYLISEDERFVWLGTILAKTLPDALWRRHRVALALPGLSSLYRSATTGSRIALGFFDLAEGVESWVERLVEFQPDTIVAPPKVLRWLAEKGKLSAANIFSGAEVLDPLDRKVIQDATGRTVRQIYMATEGLFGVSCPHGTLHLAEDAVHFEWEKVSPESPLRIPIVTDFTRRAQALVRYRMNDLLELDEEPCTCGSPHQAVKRIEGRSDDIFELRTGRGTRLVTPDVVRNAIVDSDSAISDFRAYQTGPNAIEVRLEGQLPEALDKAVLGSLVNALQRLGAAPDIAIERGIEPVFDRKLRRVERRWKGD